MTTVTAKELRLKFPEISKRIQNGESIILIYHSKPLCEMVPLQKKQKKGIDINLFKKYGFSGKGKNAVELIRNERTR
jgi:antitoxin (DNA-binding transcriptional repressor) of toxin-antitoxin stability system